MLKKILSIIGVLAIVYVILTLTDSAIQKVHYQRAAERLAEMNFCVDDNHLYSEFTIED